MPAYCTVYTELCIYSCRTVVVLVLLLSVSVPSTNSQAGCDLDLFETYSQGQYVCSSHPDLVSALQTAEEMGRAECERAFEWERWNCSSFSILKTPNITKAPESKDHCHCPLVWAKYASCIKLYYVKTVASGVLCTLVFHISCRYGCLLGQT